MLVLSRKKGQWIFIDNMRIKVVVSDVRGNTVRLGIVADKSIKIERGNPDGSTEATSENKVA